MTMRIVQSVNSIEADCALRHWLHHELFSGLRGGWRTQEIQKDRGVRTLQAMVDPRVNA
jgi:hypothetical protein